jgi:hypothetical protein
VSVVGESFADAPECFAKFKQVHALRIDAWGFLPRSEYVALLQRADVVVSTALVSRYTSDAFFFFRCACAEQRQHEFFGVSVIEAIDSGAFPLCPRRLVYPEYLPNANLYNTVPQLAKQLKRFAASPQHLRNSDWRVELAQFDWNCTLREEYMNLFTH